jgi:DNA-binding PadR family transcriptional regulator
MAELDRTIHEPVRLRIVSVLSGVDRADFNFMLATLALSRGNLASHIEKLEGAGYVEVLKAFSGKMPRTEYRLTTAGRKALGDYWASLDAIRAQSRVRQRSR